MYTGLLIEIILSIVFAFALNDSRLVSVNSNSNPATQKKELEKVYTWFCINKPLLGPVSQVTCAAIC